ncbi:hypothetical protein CK220_07465 [Mesorhizobium sp. WSM3860]|nr:hypothetical protein CK220_07465 [Mesorhizobium sp. WSM3860]
MTTLGILLCAFSMWSWMTVNSKANDTLSNIEAARDAVDRRVHTFQKSFERLQNRVGTAKFDVAELERRADEAKPDLPDLKLRVVAMTSVADDLNKELEAARAEYEAILAEWAKTQRESQIGIASVRSGLASATIFEAGYWAGGIIALFGGILWYWNFQRYQDAIVRRQATKVDSTQTTESV